MNITKSASESAKITQFLSENVEGYVTLTIYTQSGLESDISGFLFSQDNSFYISDHPSNSGFQFCASDISHISGDALVLA
jgi:hypothetical protein